MSSPLNELQVSEKEKFSQNLVCCDSAQQNLLPKHLYNSQQTLVYNYNTLKNQNSVSKKSGLVDYYQPPHDPYCLNSSRPAKMATKGGENGNSL